MARPARPATASPAAAAAVGSTRGRNGPTGSFTTATGPLGGSRSRLGTGGRHERSAVADTRRTDDGTAGPGLVPRRKAGSVPAARSARSRSSGARTFRDGRGREARGVREDEGKRRGGLVAERREGPGLGAPAGVGALGGGELAALHAELAASSFPSPGPTVSRTPACSVAGGGTSPVTSAASARTSSAGLAVETTSGARSTARPSGPTVTSLRLSAPYVWPAWWSAASACASGTTSVAASPALKGPRHLRRRSSPVPWGRRVRTPRCPGSPSTTSSIAARCSWSSARSTPRRSTTRARSRCSAGTGTSVRSSCCPARSTTTHA